MSTHKQPQEAAADPTSRIATVPIPHAIFLLLFCLFIALFIRMTQYTFFKGHLHAASRGLHWLRHGDDQTSASTGETTSLTCAHFNTLNSLRGSIYRPNLIFGDSTHRSLVSTPLLVQQHEDQPELLEMDVIVKAEEDWEVYSSMHGTNNLNTPWSWTA
ncbi:hypothetical protein NOR_02210 [Metarhizium rileyi]|uniref:Uncharacterized protein n=1 Tax=Metarhizium rileyi (strain RCEF 4871) TaxID=1649241 RepID=A0A162LZS0_METRR|nr:hypothetical protein NOR_02210 [Metarhizium rileyi RCEF 4871]